MTFQRYPADFSADGPSVDYLKLEFCRRNYSASNVTYVKDNLDPIIINIPQKVTEAMSQNFSNAQLGELGRFLGNRGGVTQAATDSVRRLFENFGLNKAVELSNKLGASGLSAAGLLSATSGVVFNPNLEVLYEGPDFRRFNFRFNLFTKSEQDATAIYNIVDILRRASLPSSSSKGINQSALQNTFFDAAQTAAVEGAATAAGTLVQGGIQGALGGQGVGGWQGAVSTILNNAGNSAGLGALGTQVGSNIFNDSSRFITQPPFVLLTYMRGANQHPFLQPLLPAAINQIDFDFTPTGNYTTVGDFGATGKATTVGVTITMQLTEVTNLFADKLFGDRAPGIDGGFKTTAPSGQQYGPMASDARLKENIVKVGSSPSGINIYEWNYKSTPDTRYRGVMAQEIMQTHPDAIHLFEDGYMGVHYSHLDVNMEVVK